jgi:hypothetical protein
MGNCCSDEAGHGGAHPVGPAAAKAASAAADRFLRSRGAGASTQIEVRSAPRNPAASVLLPPAVGQWGTRRGRRSSGAGARAPALRAAVATVRSRCVLPLCLFWDRCCAFMPSAENAWGYRGLLVSDWSDGNSLRFMLAIWSPLRLVEYLGATIWCTRSNKSGSARK